MLDLLLSPISRESFFARYWEGCPLHIPRPRPDWCAALPSVEDVDAILAAGPLDDVRLVQTQAGLATEMTGRGNGPRDIEAIYQADDPGGWSDNVNDDPQKPRGDWGRDPRANNDA